MMLVPLTRNPQVFYKFLLSVTVILCYFACHFVICLSFCHLFMLVILFSMNCCETIFNNTKTIPVKSGNEKNIDFIELISYPSKMLLFNLKPLVVLEFLSSHETQSTTRQHEKL
mmetsp:Transcript_61437/g.165035  ORF Transcript_61437/g.165035 Transcript_61437/m.165035 type:complete len:114 (-) Transcript_61437:1346-1687(-)